jgi:Uri superfamily endonuclease
MNGEMKGVYLLEIHVEKSKEIEIGSLGSIAFPRGLYVYVGSAQNSLEKRIARHYRKRKKTRWHIDYLVAAKDVSLGRAFCREGNKSRECETARSLSAAEEPVTGFGSSDCACVSHLFRVVSFNPDQQGAWREASVRALKEVKVRLDR